MSDRNLSPKLMDEAYVALERMIVNGELEPGKWVSEAELMKVSGFTRAPIRVAIQRLSEQQLIVIYPRRGAQICPLDFTLQFRALELRREVESLLVRCAARRSSQEQKDVFSKLAAEFRDSIGPGIQSLNTELDYRHFKLVCTASDNPFAERAMLSVKGLSRRFWIIHQDRFGDNAYLANCQADVASAISKGDVDEAGAKLNILVDYIEKFTLEVVGYSSSK